MSDHQLLALALEMEQTGCSLIPVGRNKQPFIKWKKYQSERAGASQLQKWATDSCTTGFAVVCGLVSGGLEILDFDNPDFYIAFKEYGLDCAEGLPVQQTGSGGFHLAYRRATPGRNIKLAFAVHEPKVDADGVMGEETSKVAIETRAEGGYALISHSLHPSGRRYEPLIGTYGNIPTIEDAQAEELLALARGLHQELRADFIKRP